MYYHKENPAKELEPFVECYFFMGSGQGPVTNFEIESPPSGFPGMVFNFGDPYRVQSNRGRAVTLPRSFVIGQTTQRYILQFNGVIDLVGIVFKPTGLYRLFGFSMPSLIDKRRDVSEVLDESMVKMYEQLACSEGSLKEKVKIINRFLEIQHKKSNAVFETFDKSLELIDERGNVTVKQLADYCSMSNRTYQRKFTEMVGVSPKLYTKLRRMSMICSMMSYTDSIDWQEVVHMGGYFDQSHFIKEFHGFIGRKPTLYFQKNKELIHYLDDE
ncbi:AraC family transcriptional regulator [Flammeovirgaceae bacterium SG7u.111]|nr:AraC family transcriptional regulator [Flammeovirgaceae bacterium SG7u.132]WPO36113.1 AraC family transcriptional regulator [Flammeovirgaceae bacterium SG7u.111]